MKKLLLTSLLLFSFLVLAGCAEKTTIADDAQTTTSWAIAQDIDSTVDTPTDDVMAAQDTTADSSSFGIESCDRYIKFLQCVMEKMPFGGDVYKEQITTLQKERRTEVDQKTLQESCDGLIKIMEQGQESFKEIGCSL